MFYPFTKFLLLRNTNSHIVDEMYNTMRRWALIDNGGAWPFSAVSFSYYIPPRIYKRQKPLDRVSVYPLNRYFT